MGGEYHPNSPRNYLCSCVISSWLALQEVVSRQGLETGLL